MWLWEGARVEGGDEASPRRCCSERRSRRGLYVSGNALFLFADVFNRRGLQSYSDESDAHFVAHLAERREHFATLARTAVPREEVARTLTLKFQSRDKSSMVKIRVFVPFPSPQRDTKLPLIVYYHGGGFVILSAHAFENQRK